MPSSSTEADVALAPHGKEEQLAALAEALAAAGPEDVVLYSDEVDIPAPILMCRTRLGGPGDRPGAGRRQFPDRNKIGPRGPHPWG